MATTARITAGSSATTRRRWRRSACNGIKNGIVWNTEATSPAVLHAYDANDLSNQLYNSSSNRDNPTADGVKFTVPTIVNGKVYMGTAGTLAVFGLLTDTTPLVVTTSGNSSVPAGFAGTTQRVTNQSYTAPRRPLRACSSTAGRM